MKRFADQTSSEELAPIVTIIVGGLTNINAIPYSIVSVKDYLRTG